MIRYDDNVLRKFSRYLLHLISFSPFRPIQHGWSLKPAMFSLRDVQQSNLHLLGRLLAEDIVTHSPGRHEEERHVSGKAQLRRN